MKKLIVLMCIMLLAGMLSAKYIYRSSESNTRFEEYEYLQGGILYRFDFRQVEIEEFEGETTTMWKYQEIWLPEEVTKAEMNQIISKEKIGKKAKSDNLETFKNNTIKPEQVLKIRRHKWVF